MLGKDVFNTFSFSIFILLFKQDLQNYSAQSHDGFLETKVTILEKMGLSLPFQINIIQLLSSRRSAVITKMEKICYRFLLNISEMQDE